MKVYDCIIFNDELDLLELRLNVLNDVVDFFVLVEGELSWQSNEKVLMFETNEKRFEKFKNRIITVTVPKSSFVSNPWINERNAFDATLKGLVDAENGDIIMVSCCDEIPNPECVKKLKDFDIIGHTHLQQKMYYYYINTVFNHWGSIYWNGTMVTKYENLLKAGNVYDMATQQRSPTPIPNGGWHFSSSGGVERLYNKLQSYSHTEYKNISKDAIKERIYNLKDTFDRENVKFHSLEPEENWPTYIRDNQDKYSDYIYER